jgi:hypothetical protein
MTLIDAISFSINRDGGLTLDATGTRYASGSRATNGGRAETFKTADRHATCTFGLAFVMSSAASGSGRSALTMSTTDGQLDLWLESGGAISVRKGASNSGTIVAQTAAGVWSANVWYYVEVQVTLGSSGSAEIKVNEVSRASVSGVDTRPNSTGSPVFSGVIWRAWITDSYSIDDGYVTNGAGSTNTGYLGDVRVEAILPTGDGNYSEWDGSDGNSVNNYQLVDDVSMTDYVTTAVDGERDSYAMANLPAAVSGKTVFGAIGFAQANCAAVPRRLKQMARLSGTNLDSGEQQLTTGNLWYYEPFETKPGGGAWATSDIDSAEFGVVCGANSP